MKALYKMVATSAIHDGKRDTQDYTDVCHPGTREEYLENLKAWADKAPPETRVEWVNAIAGAGKTAMLRSFCTLLEDQGVPPFSFFVWKGDAKRNTLEHFPATIAHQLCQMFPVLVSLVEKAINAAPFLLQSTFKKQMDKLFIGPLLEACDTIKTECHLIIVLDGLDELDAKGQTELLNFIPYLISRLSTLPISLLVSSRPDPQIVGAFNHPKLSSITRATRLGASDADIRKFLEDKFEDINLRHPHLRIEHGVGGKWPGDKKLKIMIKQSSGLFIWPTVAIGHIDKVEKALDHNARLEQVLSSAAKPWIGSPLDNLYRTILEAHAPEDRTSYAFFRFKRRLALLCILELFFFHVRKIGKQVFDCADVPVRAIFGETLDELWSSVAGLSSFFLPRRPLSEEDSPAPSISHLSLRDFTFNKERCGEELYYSSEQELRAEVISEFITFINTPQGYQVRNLTHYVGLFNTFVKNIAEMGAWSIFRIGQFLAHQLKQAALSEKVGSCVDDIVLDFVPRTWPLVTQVFTAIHLFDPLYMAAGKPVSELLIALVRY